MDGSDATVESTADRLSEVDQKNAELPGRLAGLSVRRQVVVLATWPFLEQLLSFSVGFVDVAIAARLSVAATESIAVGAYVSWLLSMLFGAIGIGAGALVSRSIGGRESRVARGAMGQSLTASAVLGVCFWVVIWIATPLLCHLMNLVGESHRLAVEYLRWVGIGAPALGLLFVSAACLRSGGDTRTPFLVLAFVNFVNIVGSLVFVYGPDPIGGRGVVGIAMGTVMAWSVGAIAIVFKLSRRGSVIRLFWHRLLPQWKALVRILRISGPQFIDSLSIWMGNFVLAAMVGYLGRTDQVGALAAHIVVIRIEAISYLSGWAIGQAAATLVGQYLGLDDANRANAATRCCWLLGVIVMGTMGLGFFVFSDALIGLITDEPALHALAPPVLRVCGPAQIFLATIIVLEHAVRGAGDTRPVALIVAASTFLVRLPAAYFLGIVLGKGILGIWVAVCSELVLRAAFITAYFLSGRWCHTRV